MAVNDLTNTTWVLNSTAVGPDAFYYSVNVSFNDAIYSYFVGKYSGGYDCYLFGVANSAYVNPIHILSQFGGSTSIVETGSIEFLGGTDATNASLITWLTANATQIVPPTTWKFKSHITDTVPGSGDYLRLNFNYYCELTAADMGTSNCCYFVSEGVLTPFSTWQELVVQLPDALEAFGATDVTSTLSASSVPADYKTKWSAEACSFYGNESDGYFFGPAHDYGYSDDWTISEYPDITGTISFTFDGNSYNLNFTQLLQAIIDVTGASLFEPAVSIYHRETGYTCEGMRTITITGGTDADNADLIAWLQANAVEVVPFTEGVRVTYNGDVIKQLDTDGTFALSCANKIMTSNITIETIDAGSIVVTYNNDTIIDSSGTHTYQLPCNKKMADTDIVVAYAEPMNPPSKGDIINIDMTGSGTAQTYRVIKNVGGSVVEVIAMSDATSTTFDIGNTNTYEGKPLDTYLNTTWYNTLSATAKTAIVDKTFRQDSWYWNSTSGNPIYQGKYSGNKAYQLSLGNASFGNEITRHAYAISVQDVLDYLEVTPEMTQADTTLTHNNVWTMFWNSTTTHSGNPWLRSALASNASSAFFAYGRSGSLTDNSATNRFAVRPAFQIDLSKIEWN